MSRLALLSALFALSGSLFACASRPSPEAADWIARATRTHEASDQALLRGDRSAARRVLAELVNQAPPSQVANDDRRVVLQDACFRLAELELDAQAPRAALGWIEHGLALGRPADVFVANLLVARAQAHERLGDDATATADYHEALVINGALLEQALRAEGNP
jgi:hypothetical protein